MRLIDADALKTVHGMGDDCAECDKEERKKSTKCEYDRNFTKMDFCGWLEDAPTVDAVPVRRGKWILQGDRRKTLYGWYFCSECGACIGGKTNFCSECGADMRGERHDVI